MERVIGKIFSLSQSIRYVAVYREGALTSAVRDGLAEASTDESDRYEELLVNPALLTLTRQRGDLDCGGLRYVLVRYGNFFQFIRPIVGGHVSIAIEPTGDPVGLAGRIESVVAGAE